MMIKNRFVISDKRFILVTLSSFLFILSMCDDKMPTLPVDLPDSLFNPIVIESDLIEDAVQVVSPRIGNTSRLFVGKNEEVTAYSLLRFTVPNTLDSLIDVRLKLFTATELPYDSLNCDSAEISVNSLEPVAQDLPIWVEDSTNSTTFSLDDFKQKEIRTFKYANYDTVYVPLDTALLNYWEHNPDKNYGLLIRQSDNSIGKIQTFYSREYNLGQRIEIRYIEEGDTLTSYIYPTADVSILNFIPKEPDPGRLSISSGRATLSFLKFNVESKITNANEVIAEAILHLKIDTALTQIYGENFYFYLSLLDSATYWNNPDFTPSSSSYKSSVQPNDTSINIKISKTIQYYTSEDGKNFGIVLWASSSNPGISTLSVFGSTSSDTSKRPIIEILTMKEE